MSAGSGRRSTLEARIGHRFADPALLGTALTHRSYSAAHNERLEFVGDGVLNCVVAELLFRRFPELPEGDLSRLRAGLVCQDALHGVAMDLGLGDALSLGDGEKKSGGATRPSILADAVEAVIGAVYLDAGFLAARAVVDRHLAPLIARIDLTADRKDAKTRLQEILQGRRLPLPEYTIVETRGEQHEQEFVVRCTVPKLSISAEAGGPSRRVAEQRAAKLALEAINAQGGRP